MEKTLDDLIEKYTKLRAPPDVTLVWSKCPLTCTIPVHRSVVTAYSTLIRALLTPQSNKKAIIPCDSRSTLYRVLTWIYRKELHRAIWPSSKSQLMHWSTTLKFYKAAQELGIGMLTMELNAQLNKALIHHARELPFAEATALGIDTSLEAVCVFINELYGYDGRVGLHALIHVLLAAGGEGGLRDLLFAVRQMDGVNPRFLGLVELAAEEVVVMMRERCCLSVRSPPRDHGRSIFL
ncbi:hypothetical protein TWF481_003155 [Arthrobotrys musiformis]|uniref:BTB domain-containing protein n=1 Tax=Arthrobotrys musiformis TaxID=47236 RepID=A0AAV9VSF5_9PEZI